MVQSPDAGRGSHNGNHGGSWREQGDSGPLWQTNRLVDIDDSIQNLKTTG
ncbi:hypothetical protein [Escherichia coli]